ncbi:SUKH-3 domain-containing protein [Chromobacterium rhizoryzae]|uniref:SUKH-3 domain-containing protein n=1 Tax=Chromobacterium rhizoryzae TaxID=1778675 RepID=UPI001D07FCA8|nr:SUKH-3 domain-containing protein [Chromobacterium rhizoryzae]
MTYEFTPEIEAKLIEYGWHPSRFTNNSKTLSIWKNEGYDIFQEGLNFINSFNGIILKHSSRSGEFEDESCFDGALAAEGFDRLWAIEVYEPIIGKKLLPIGQGYSRHLTYLISEDGAIYGGYDDFLCQIGINAIKAIENIILNHEFTVLNS